MYRLTVTLYALAAIGNDRPGIVAMVARVLAEHGANLEDSSMTGLAGQFAIMLIIDADESEDVGALRAGLDRVADALGLWINLTPIDRPKETHGDTLTVSVHGADHPGIVAGITGTIAEYSASIVDMSTRRIDAGDGVVTYVMSLDIDLSETQSRDRLISALEEMADSLGVTLRVSDSGVDLL